MSRNRGYTDLQQKPIVIGGLRAVYSLAELDLVVGMPLREVAVIHHLKALFGGELLASDDPSLGAPAPSEGPVYTKKGLVPTPRRRKNEPLAGQTAIAD